ncbi:MAG: serine/threonine-protein kinase [Pirellulaceae bacterium]|nr:serine/threonine protein kinase [Planctomycetales bacterium]
MRSGAARPDSAAEPGEPTHASTTDLPAGLLPGGSELGKNDRDSTVISTRPPVGDPYEYRGVASSLGPSLEGRQLAHFLLERFIGGGGMGAVFRGVDTMLGRTVAIKVLSPSHNSTAESIRRFKNEAQSAARLDHENIARVYYVGEDAGWNFIVFEYIDGENIRDLVLRRGPLGLNEAISYIVQVCDALQHAYERDVVHRDVKPSNILVTQAGRVKLVDMGLARLHQVQSDEDDLTASGVTLGTFDYISPEQARDPRDADVRSDIYSLGCTFYFLLSGQPPFPQGTVLQKLLSHSGDEPPDIRQFRDDVPDDIIRVLRTMMAKQPSRRYSTPRHVISDLAAVADRNGLVSLGGNARDLLHPHGAPRGFAWAILPWAVPLSALLLFVIVLDGLLREGEMRAEQLPEIVYPERAATAADVVASLSTAGRQFPSVHGNDSSDTEAAGTVIPKRRITDGVPSELVPAFSESSTDDEVTQKVPPGRPPISRIDDTEPFIGENLETSFPLLDASERISPSISTTTDDPVVKSAPPLTGTLPPARRSIAVVPLGFERISVTAQETVTSISDALATATSDGEVQIQLYYDGPQDEQPLRIDRQRVTIEAAPGFRPVVRFQLDDIESTQTMLDVTGGEFHLLGVDLTFVVPDYPVDQQWQMVRLRDVTRCVFRRCWLTISNIHSSGALTHENVAFIDIESQVSRREIINGSASPTTETVVQLTDCVVRGQADMVRLRRPVPLALTWSNGLLATTGSLVRQLRDPFQSMPSGKIQIDLNQVTMFAENGLLRTFADQWAQPVFVTCDASILLTKGQPLIRQDAVGLDWFDLDEQLTYQDDNTFYENASAFVSQYRLDEANDAPPELEMYSLNEWLTLHDQATRPTSSLMIPRRLPLPSSDMRHDTLTPAHFEFAPPLYGNPPVRSANPGADVKSLTSDMRE